MASDKERTYVYQCASIPPNVVDVVNQSNDVVPALFAIPADSRHPKKLKLCKRVGWLRNGILTTGFMEIKLNEAKEKGIFNQPRRVTLINKSDQLYQSVDIRTAGLSTNVKPILASDLNCLMLNQFDSSVGIIDSKGELVPNKITLTGQDATQTAGVPGKIIPFILTPSMALEASTKDIVISSQHNISTENVLNPCGGDGNASNAVTSKVAKPDHKTPPKLNKRQTGVEVSNPLKLFSPILPKQMSVDKSDVLLQFENPKSKQIRSHNTANMTEKEPETRAGKVEECRSVEENLSYGRVSHCTRRKPEETSKVMNAESDLSSLTVNTISPNTPESQAGDRLLTSKKVGEANKTVMGNTTESGNKLPTLINTVTLQDTGKDVKSNFKKYESRIPKVNIVKLDIDWTSHRVVEMTGKTFSPVKPGTGSNDLEQLRRKASSDNNSEGHSPSTRYSGERKSSPAEQSSQQNSQQERLQLDCDTTKPSKQASESSACCSGSKIVNSTDDRSRTLSFKPVSTSARNGSATQVLSSEHSILPPVQYQQQIPSTSGIILRSVLENVCSITSSNQSTAEPPALNTMSDNITLAIDNPGRTIKAETTVVPSVQYQKRIQNTGNINVRSTFENDCSTTTASNKVAVELAALNKLSDNITENFKQTSPFTDGNSRYIPSSLISNNSPRATVFADSSQINAGGFPSLRIGSVFSLSEKQANELFPKPSFRTTNKTIKQESVGTSYSEMPVSDATDGTRVGRIQTPVYKSSSYHRPSHVKSMSGKSFLYKFNEKSAIVNSTLNLLTVPKVNSAHSLPPRFTMQRSDQPIGTGMRSAYTLSDVVQRVTSTPIVIRPPTNPTVVSRHMSPVSQTLDNGTILSKAVGNLGPSSSTTVSKTQKTPMMPSISSNCEVYSVMNPVKSMPAPVTSVPIFSQNRPSDGFLTLSKGGATIETNITRPASVGGKAVTVTADNTNTSSILPNKTTTSTVISSNTNSFLVTCNGKRQIFSIRPNTSTLSVLANIARKTPYKYIVPKKAEKRIVTNKSDPKSPPKYLMHKRSKTSVPILKIKFPSVSDLRKSTRERETKRPYSPTSEDSSCPKVPRQNTPAQDEETSPVSSSQIPHKVKIEPPSLEEPRLDYLGSECIHSPVYRPDSEMVDRDSRVKQLRELMKQEEKALAEILQRRNKEVEERLADPELCDL